MVDDLLLGLVALYAFLAYVFFGMFVVAAIERRLDREKHAYRYGKQSEWLMFVWPIVAMVLWGIIVVQLDDK